MATSCLASVVSNVVSTPAEALPTNGKTMTFPLPLPLPRCGSLCFPLSARVIPVSLPISPTDTSVDTGASVCHLCDANHALTVSGQTCLAVPSIEFLCVPMVYTSEVQHCMCSVLACVYKNSSVRRRAASRLDLSIRKLLFLSNLFFVTPTFPTVFLLSIVLFKHTTHKLMPSSATNIFLNTYPRTVLTVMQFT
jgi:hypothetical protein